MRLKEEKIKHIANLIVSRVVDRGWGDFPDPGLARRVIVEAITSYLKTEDEVDERVRERLSSYYRKVPEGSAQWEALYRQLYSKEIGRARTRR